MLTLPLPTALAISVVGIAAGAAGAWRQTRWLRRARWPRVAGRVTASWVHGAPRSLGGDYFGEAHALGVEYEYAVGGAAYRGRCPAFRAETSEGTAAEADALARLYRPGAAVFVYYDPRRPARCALEVPGPGAGLALLAGGAAVAAGGLWLAWGATTGPAGP